MSDNKDILELYEQQLLHMEQVCHMQTQENSRLKLELMRKNDVDGIQMRKLEERGTKLTRLEDKFRKTTLADYRHDFTFGGRAIYTAEQLEDQKKAVFKDPVKFSIIVPVYNTDKDMLYEMLCSVLDQTYPNFELCIADGSDREHLHTEKACKAVSSAFGGRLKYKKITNGGISSNSNEALAMATGDWIVLLDHDDLLHPSALYSVMRRIEDTGADFIYSDESRFTGVPQNNIDSYPYYKPDYSPDLLRSMNYICHMVAFKKTLLNDGEGFDQAYDGSQDYDLVLRMTERASRVEHIPQVLYYWRLNTESVSATAAAGSNVYANGREAVQAQMDRLGIKGTAQTTPDAGYFRVRYAIEGEPKVSIVILNRDHRKLLERCVDSILSKSTYGNYEIVICENGSNDKDIFEYYDSLKSDPKVKIVNWTEGGEFNYPRLNNFGAKNAAGDYILLLNNDTEVITDDWIEELLGLAQRQDTGVVGCMLRYPDDTIQHAGIFLSGGQSMHDGLFESSLAPGYRGINRCVKDVSAVTGACMMIRRDVWDKLGGLNEDYAVAYNDIDLCLRAREAGYRIIFTPHAALYHYEGRSRGFRRMEDSDIAREEAERIRLLKDHPVTAIRDPYRSAHYRFDGYYCEYIETAKDKSLAKLLEANREIPMLIDMRLPADTVRQLFYAASVILDMSEGISLTDMSDAKNGAEDHLLITSYGEYQDSDIGGKLIAAIDDLVILGYGDRAKLNSSDEGDFSIASGRFLGTGFHPSESNGMCWSAEGRTEIRLSGLDKCAYKFTILHGYSIPLAELGKESFGMSIDVNGAHITDITIDSANNGQDISFDVPESAMSGKTDIVSITTDTWSPTDYGSGDRRTLGFSTSGLKALKLN